MAQTIYCLISDGGDGSSSLTWIRNEKIVEILLNDEQFLEQYYCNEGSSYTFTFPDDFDFKACGITFSDEDWEERYKDASAAK